MRGTILKLSTTNEADSRFNERVNRLIKLLPINVVYFDRESQIRGMSDSVLKEFGYRLEEVLHHPVTDFLPPEAAEKCSSRHPNFWSEGDMTMETTVRSQNGSSYRVRVSITIDLDDRGDAAGAMAVLNVISVDSDEPWRERKSDLPYGLTGREHQVLEAAAKGKTSKMIGDMLEISHETVNKHIAHVLVKMNAPSRIDACVRAAQEGWLFQSRTVRRRALRLVKD